MNTYRKTEYFRKRFNSFLNAFVPNWIDVAFLTIFAILQFLNMVIGLNVLIIILYYGISQIISKPLTRGLHSLKVAGVVLLVSTIQTDHLLLGLLVLLIVFLLYRDWSFVVVLYLFLFLYDSEGFAFLICPYFLFVVCW